MARVGVRVTTLGSKGVEIVGRDLERIQVPAAQEYSKADPTGVGDGFRAGFLSARAWGLSWQRAAEVGGLLATLVLETVGTQEYDLDRRTSRGRLACGDEGSRRPIVHARRACRFRSVSTRPRRGSN